MDSLSPIYEPIELTRDGSWVRTVLLYDVAGNLTPATGWTIEGSIRASAGDPDGVIAPITVDPVSPGQLLVKVKGSDLEGIGGDQETIRLAYAIRATKSGQLPEVLMHGPLIVSPRIFA